MSPLCHSLSESVGTGENVQQKAFVNIYRAGNKDKKLTWSEEVKDRTFNIKSKCNVYIYQSMQPLKDHDSCNIKKNVYFMCCFSEVDLLEVSRKEIFYETLRQPNCMSCLEIYEENDEFDMKKKILYVPRFCFEF